MATVVPLKKRFMLGCIIEGLASRNGDTNVASRKLNGVELIDPDSYTVPSAREHCGSSNGRTVLRATSNATAHAYVDGTSPNDNKAGKKVDVEGVAGRKWFTCTERRKNADGIESAVECVPPEPN